MKDLMTPEQLIAFEDDIAECFKNKMIKAPIHLSYDNEEQMIEIFKEVQSVDWCVCSWRSHYHCLLKKMPPEKVKADILNGRSIEMCNKEYKIFSSAIVAGNIPIALGLAKNIKLKGGDNKVWCFVGDTTSMAGAFFEAYSYAKNWDLPITFVIEDNKLSVCSHTRSMWNTEKLFFEPDQIKEKEVVRISKYLWYYTYDLHKKYPHAGPGGARIQF